ncbi:hypothetical protein OG711_08870 [Streptomyces uncialis]|uniref:hypothetical protein n=1 Tax=Streptomyces uncialis TaxID=1048205 RepID=UPI002E3028DC|nr:hypothetical protein [Streptomyces uncialis]
MICSHCDQPIQDHEAYERQSSPSASGPGTTLYRHAVPCRERTGPAHGGADTDTVGLAWGRLLTHLDNCAECLGDDPWDCRTAHTLRRAWRAARSAPRRTPAVCAGCLSARLLGRADDIHMCHGVTWMRVEGRLLAVVAAREPCPCPCAS